MKKSTTLTKCLALSASAVFVCQSEGVTLASDNFSYPDGSLVPNGGWATHSGNAGDLLVSNGAAVVQHGVPSEDANLSIGTQTMGILTATFDIFVTADAQIGANGTDFEYFAHFRNGNTFRSRLDVVAPSGDGDFTLGISSATSTADATLGTDFSFGEIVSVAIAFDFDTGIGSLTVGGETISGDASGAGATLTSFALRQSDSTINETVTVDNLVVSSTVPEPSTALLGGLALLGLLRRRR